MRTLVISAAARRDLAHIWKFIAADNPDAADRVAAEFRTEFDQLVINPNRGHRHTEIRDPQYRVSNLYSYLIVFRSTLTSLHIVRVIHGKRNIQGMF